MISKNHSINCLTALLLFCNSAAFGFDLAHTPKTPFNQNEIKSFVYYWFSLFDKNAPVQRFEEVLLNQGLEMRFPEKVLHSHQDFRDWYAQVLKTYRLASHELKQLDVTLLNDQTARVELVVLWKAQPFTGNPTQFLAHQIWTIKNTGSAIPQISSYQVEPANPSHSKSNKN